MSSKDIEQQILIDAKATWLSMNEEQRTKCRLNGTVKFAQTIIQPYINHINNYDRMVNLILTII